MDLQILLVNAILSVMGAVFVAAAAFLFIYRPQQEQADTQIKLARMELLSKLEDEYDEILNKPSVYDVKFDSAGAQETKVLPLLSVIDDLTIWNPNVQRIWNSQYGERTIKFVSSSEVVSSNAEISTALLQRYWNWLRRFKRGVVDGILKDDDLFHFWAAIYGLATHGKYSFFVVIYPKGGMNDYVDLIDMMLANKRVLNETYFLEWLAFNGDIELINKLSYHSQKLIRRTRKASERQ